MPTIEDDVAELAGIVMSHTALITTLLGVLQKTGALSQNDVNQVVDLALVGMENVEGCRPSVANDARQVLEGFAATMGGPLRAR